MDPVERIISQPAGPEKESWYRFQWQEEQETPLRLEDAAKFLASMISISLTIFLSVSGKSTTADAPGSFSNSIVLIFWILSLLSSFFVLFPFRYRYSKDSIKTFQKAHQKIVSRKRAILLFSLVCYFLALGLLGVLFLCR